MIYYLLLILWLAICYIAIYKLIKLKNRKKYFLLVSFLSLSFLSCFRDYSVGADTQQWVDFYTIYGQIGFKAVNFSQMHEPGYVLLNVILFCISPDPRCLIIVSSLIINFCVVYFIGKHSRDVFLSMLFWICTKQFFGSLCMVRQFLAISIVLLAFGTLLSRRYLLFTLAVILASSFHYFAILNLLLIPMFCIGKLRKSHIVLISVLMILCFAFMPQIVTFFFTNVSNYSDYLNYMKDYGADPDGFQFPFRLLVVLAYLLPYLFKKFRIDNEKGVEIQGSVNAKRRITNYGILITIYVLIVCLYILSSRFILIMRIYDYFMPFLILVPNIVDTKKNKELTVYYLALSLGYILFAFMFPQDKFYGTENFLFFWD